MLQLRKDQVAAFRAKALDRYVGDIIEHFRTFFPRYYDVVGTEALSRLIRLGIERARSYGIESQRDVCLYVTLMLCFGSQFDMDPQYPWAAEILADIRDSRAGVTVGRLFDTGMERLEAIAGPDNGHLKRAIVSLRSLPMDHPAFSADRSAVDGFILDTWSTAYPTKLAQVGRRSVDALLAESGRRSGDLDLRMPQGLFTFATLSFLLGVGFAQDPQHGWAAEALGAYANSPESVRIQRLRLAAGDFANRLFSDSTDR